MARKLAKDENYLELIPIRNPEIKYFEDDKGIVTLLVPNIGFFNRVAQKCFQRPEVSHIHLDDYSSYVWLGINGKRDIGDLGTYLKRKYGEEAEPLYERLIRFVYILKDNRYVGLTDKDGVHIK